MSAKISTRSIELTSRLHVETHSISTTTKISMLKKVLTSITALDQVPVVILELVDSAMNFIIQDAYDKALILLQKAVTML